MIRIVVKPVPRTHEIFETAFGWSGVVWSGTGVARVFLPEPDRDRLSRRIDAVLPDGPFEAGFDHAELACRIQRYFAGEVISFDDVTVDLGTTDAFKLAIYSETRALSFGVTATYGELAKRAGFSGLTRETGQALGSNPVPLIVPCHRIVAAGNKIGGFSAPGGSETKRRMLALEGVKVADDVQPRQFAFEF